MIRIAIFNNIVDAQAYADKIHNYLLNNRPGYNAEKWCDPEQSTDGTEFFVKQPIEEEVQKWPVPINTETEKAKAQGVTEALPEVGGFCEIGKYYLHKGDILKCRQSHNRTIYEPKDTPNLFSYFRDNSDQLQWIAGEQVEAGWVRIYNDVKYEVIQPHQTQSDWPPTSTLGNLWKVYQDSEQQEKPPQWLSAEYYKYVVGYEVFDSGKVWRAKNTTHTWIQPALTGDGAISWEFVKDWV